MIYTWYYNTLEDNTSRAFCLSELYNNDYMREEVEDDSGSCA